MFLRSVLAVALAVSLTSWAIARDLTADEQSSLDARITEYRDALDKRDASFMVEVTPPRILMVTAEKLGVDVDQLRETMTGQIREMLTEAETFTFELDEAAMRVRETPNGTLYVLIPTKTELSTEEVGRIRTESSTLAFMADGKWWLAGTQGPSTAAALVEAYPELDGIQIPESKISVRE